MSNYVLRLVPRSLGEGGSLLSVQTMLKVESEGGLSLPLFNELLHYIGVGRTYNERNRSRGYYCRNIK